MLTLIGTEWDAYPFDLAHTLDAAARFVLIGGAVGVLLVLIGLAVISRVVWVWRASHAQAMKLEGARARILWRRRPRRV